MELNKKDLIKKIMFQSSLGPGGPLPIPYRKVEKTLNTFINSIKSALASGEDVKIRNFGNLLVKKTKEHIRINPATGEKILIKSENVVSFKSAKALIHRLNRIVPFSVDYSDRLDSLLDLANEITPLNWNVFYKFDDFIYDPDVLNIYISIPTYKECEDLEEEEGSVIAAVLDNIRRRPLSSVIPTSPKSEIALKEHGNIIINEIYMKIYNPYSEDSLECSVVHELAHVAVSWKRIQTEELEDSEPMHGELFQEEYEKLIKIVGKKYGTERTSEMRGELEGYQKDWFPEGY